MILSLTPQLINMKTLLLAIILSVTLSGTSIYDFKVPSLEGNTIDFSDYKGKKILIVNTASACGNTPQYANLETLHKKYKDKLAVLTISIFFPL